MKNFIKIEYLEVYNHVELKTLIEEALDYSISNDCVCKFN